MVAGIDAPSLCMHTRKQSTVSKLAVNVNSKRVYGRLRIRNKVHAAIM